MNFFLFYEPTIFADSVFQIWYSVHEYAFSCSLFLVCVQILCSLIHFQSILVKQFQIQNWPASRTKPDSLLTILDVISDVEKSVRMAKAKGPIIVHCE